MWYTFRLPDNKGSLTSYRQVVGLYFGSVRFFKNLIFITVCLLIAVPSVLALHFHRQAERERLLSAELRDPLVSDSAVASQAQENVFEPDRAENSEGADGSNAEAQPLYADPPSYQALYEDFYAPQPYAATERLEKTAYLTFDDGPSERTDEILSILAKKNVKATFFVIGHPDDDTANLQRLKRIAEEGHTIGMHSFSHDYPKVYASVESFLDEFSQIFTQIRNTTGVSPTAFRFPGGSINGYDAGFYQEIITEMMRRGFVPYDWNVSSEDAVVSLEPTDRIISNVVNGSAGKVRAFILFHDSEPKTTTVEALGPIIDQLRAQGFEFAAVTPATLPVLYNYTY